MRTPAVQCPARVLSRPLLTNVTSLKNHWQRTHPPTEWSTVHREYPCLKPSRSKRFVYAGRCALNVELRATPTPTPHNQAHTDAISQSLNLPDVTFRISSFRHGPLSLTWHPLSCCGYRPYNELADIQLCSRSSYRQLHTPALQPA